MCGLFGVVAYNADNSIVDTLVKNLAKESEDRGTDAGGISFKNASGLVCVRNKGKISDNGVLLQKFNESNVVMGHTRMTTQGSALRNSNNHPFPSRRGKFSMAHNGVLWNDYSLTSKYHLDLGKVETDSYVVVSYLDKVHDGVISFETLRDVAEKLSGTFNLTFLDKNNTLWIVRHNNPLKVINIKEWGLIAYASEDYILNLALSSTMRSTKSRELVDYLMTHKGDNFADVIPTASGDILKIDKDGTITTEHFKPNDNYGHTKSYAHIYGYDYDYPTDRTTYVLGTAEDDDALERWYDEMYVKGEMPFELGESLPPTGEKSDIDMVDTIKANIQRGSGNVLIFNGYEFEVVENFDKTNQPISYFLGKTLDDKDKWKKITRVLTPKEMMKEISIDDLQEVCYYYDMSDSVPDLDFDPTFLSNFVRKLCTNLAETIDDLQESSSCGIGGFKTFLRDGKLFNLLMAYLFTEWVIISNFDSVSEFQYLQRTDIQAKDLPHLRNSLMVLDNMPATMIYKYCQAKTIYNLALLNVEYIIGYDAKDSVFYKKGSCLL